MKSSTGYSCVSITQKTIFFVIDNTIWCTCLHRVGTMFQFVLNTQGKEKWNPLDSLGFIVIRMLTKRQSSIFLELCEKVGEYYKANYFSDKFNISLRTIQNDIKAIKEDTASLSDIFIIDSRVPFGTRIKILDRERFAHYLNDLKM